MTTTNVADHKCEGCGKAASLRCPTCLKLGLPNSGFFCSQDCFRANWVEHKLKHTAITAENASSLVDAINNAHSTANNQVTNDKKGPYNPFPNYRYTGGLRPCYPLSAPRSVPKHIMRPDYAEDGIPYSENKVRGSSEIKVNSAKEIKAMRKAGIIAREVMNEGLKAIKVGATTDEVDRVVHEAAIERNAYPSPLNYRNFAKSCCTSVNEVICHGVPDQYEIKDGDLVNLDVTTYFNGYHGDLNETVCVGNVDKAGRKLVKTTRECFEKARNICKPGVFYRDLGNVIQKHAQSQGFSVVRSFCGHGINTLFHCAPSVPHYAKNKTVGVMKPGHIFTIEPMINEGVWQDAMWPDNWTAVTADGKRSAQFEQTLLITEHGVETLTGDFWTPVPVV